MVYWYIEAMDLTNRTTIKEILKKHNAEPKKWFGQHFILSKSALRKMVEATEIKSKDIIIEIGPGLGTLTQELAETQAKIFAIEKDELMMEILKDTLKNFNNVEIIQSDARQLSILRIHSGNEGKYKIVANLPYNIATFLIHQWLESDSPPQSMVLMIQKEVAQRMVAKPPRGNLLGLSVQFYADAEIIDYVSKKSFWPAPKVDSAIIKIIPRKKPEEELIKNFFKIAKAGFSSPRKQLAGNLTKNLKLPKEKILQIFQKIGVPEKARAENLSLENWLNLTHEVIHK
jgi:16S rRNA (adenine1518-N6/adenine1519-N6)-dimethyltransferase